VPGAHSGRSDVKEEKRKGGFGSVQLSWRKKNNGIMKAKKKKKRLEA
jgi:hypothetical protein